MQLLQLFLLHFAVRVCAPFAPHISQPAPCKNHAHQNEHLRRSIESTHRHARTEAHSRTCTQKYARTRTHSQEYATGHIFVEECITSTQRLPQDGLYSLCFTSPRTNVHRVSVTFGCVDSLCRAFAVVPLLVGIACHALSHAGRLTPTTCLGRSPRKVRICARTPYEHGTLPIARAGAVS